MKILVTGGAGFIGSHLCERLLMDGHVVTILDNLHEYYDRRIKEENLASVRKRGGGEIHIGDVCDTRFVRIVCRVTEPDVVIHLAARAGVRPSIEDPVGYTQVNVGGTAVILEAAREYQVRKCIIASSSAVYGKTTQTPFREDGLELHPISPYGVTKFAGEKLAYNYAHLFGMDIACLRFFTVYGPRQRPDLAIHKFMKLIQARQPIPFFGDGTSGRDYTFISDIVDGIIATLESPGSYRVLNLGNSSPVPLATMVTTLEDALGIPALLHRLPYPPGDMPLTWADITKARICLGYNPKVSFPDGIRQMVDWFRAQGTV